MYLRGKFPLILLLTALPTVISFGQDREASRFDFGRMWTFENPPVEWFKQAYDFSPEEEWFDDVRLSSLRFASWCSSSFVSPDGLILTNYHCSRDVAITIQNEGEDFDKNGFYASTRDEERRVPNLFVEQLLMTADITDEVNAKTANAENAANELQLRAAALEEIQQKYSSMEGWSGLRLQTVTFYSGRKFAIYGYKRYDDVRLVLLPENDLGLYGGDPDNFTYPRYNLDFTFWRVYDENGAPLNSADHYFEFNTDGIQEDVPVFVIGNPGSTERYRTVAQLEYDLNYRYKYLVRWLTNRRDMMQEEYDQMKSDASKIREAQELLGTINSLSNSIKATSGIVRGLQNEELFGRKVQMEQKIRKASPGINHWDELEKAYDELEPHSWAVTYLGPTPLNGNGLRLLHELNTYQKIISNEGTGEETNATREGIVNLIKGMDRDKEKKMLKTLLREIEMDIYPGDPTLKQLLAGQSVDAYVDQIFEESKLLKSEASAAKFLEKDKKVTKNKDPLLQAADILIPKYEAGVTAFQGSTAKRRTLEANVVKQVFEVYGTSLPPDATFTLRISDGVVKGYDYNGTIAPYKTTYFGLYNRHYAHDEVYPWAVPERWKNPPMELLKSPLNFVSTNDTTGGNSGSPMINQEGELVGLLFDGNIESLPGNFIFDDTYNRCISVHAGGIHAALKYIYKATSLVNEIEGK